MTAKQKLRALFEKVYTLEGIPFQIKMLLKAQRVALLGQIDSMSDEKAEEIVNAMVSFLSDIGGVLGSKAA